MVFPGVDLPLWLVVPGVFASLFAFAPESFDGTYHLVSARDAERWTSKDLKRTCGRGWHVIDWISFEYREVDHVLVGPGGVFAIETKYTDSTMTIEGGYGARKADEWSDQVSAAARSVRLLLRDHQIDVQPLVVVWGAEVAGLPALVGGAPIVPARELKSEVMPWRKAGDRLTDQAVREIVADLYAFRQMRLDWEKEQARAASPRRMILSS